jgi:uncharacterized protein YjbJ (UPF0337 family)
MLAHQVEYVRHLGRNPLPAKERTMKSRSKPCGWIITTAQQQRRDLDATGLNNNTWRRSIDAARALWSKLTYEELLHTNGETQQLTGLIEKRYVMAGGEVDRQVKKFMNQCGS